MALRGHFLSSQTQRIAPENGLSSQTNQQRHRRGTQAKRQHGCHTATDDSRAGGGRARDVNQPARQYPGPKKCQ